MALSDKVKAKLQDLPGKPGVYLMRDRNGRVIYVGKAKSLRSRVRNYFQKGTLRSADPKVRSLINSIEDFDFLVVHNEADAVLTEGRMIKEYRPRYNSTFKDDKRFLLLSLDLDQPFPRMQLCRIRKHDGKTYFGPYASSASARAALAFAERRFGLRRCRPRVPGVPDYKHCLADIIQHCSAPCVGSVSPEEYRQRAEEAAAFLRGERSDVLKELEVEMKQLAEQSRFEDAAVLRDTLILLRRALKQRASGRRTMVVRKEEIRTGLYDLQKVLKLGTFPQVIETFDISNISGTYAVASMVVAVDGLPRRNRYRHFRMKSVAGIDDPGMMKEAVHRRYRRILDEKEALPDLVVADGGITQLRAAREALDELGLQHLPAIGLAKRFEEIYWDITNLSPPIRLGLDAPGLKILQQIRDEAHRFALTYHRKIRSQRIRDSRLDEIPGIGDKRKALLLSHFGSVDRLRRATEKEMAAVPGIGPKFARMLQEALRGVK